MTNQITHVSDDPRINELLTAERTYLGEARLVAAQGDPYACIVPHAVQDTLATVAADRSVSSDVRARAKRALLEAHRIWLQHVITSRQLFNVEADDEGLRQAATDGIDRIIDRFVGDTSSSFSTVARGEMYELMRRRMACRSVDSTVATRIKLELDGLERRYVKRLPAPDVADGERLYLRTIDRHPVMPYAVQDRLIAISRDDRLHPPTRQRARELVVLGNQKWVIQKAYSKEFRGRGIGPTELIQAGNEGLMEAFDKYTLARNNSFITFAKHKIHMRMQRLTENDSAGVHGVRLPVDYYNFVHVTVKRAHTTLERELDRQPTAKEVHELIAGQTRRRNGSIESEHEAALEAWEAARALALEAPPIEPAALERWKAARALSQRPRPVARKPQKIWSLEEVEGGLDWLFNRHPVSLQQRVGDDDGNEFGDLLEGDERVDERVIRSVSSTSVTATFAALDEDERRVLGSCLGYGQYPELKTINRVAEHYGIDPADARRTFASAQRKMQAYIIKSGYTKNSQ